MGQAHIKQTMHLRAYVHMCIYLNTGYVIRIKERTRRRLPNQKPFSKRFKNKINITIKKVGKNQRKHF